MTKVVMKLVDLHMMKWDRKVPRYLVMQRSEGQIYEHVWQGVTGKIRAGEQAWRAALRELDEETGLAAHRLWTVDHVNLFYESSTDSLNCIPVFGVEVADGEVILSAEHRDYRWCPVEEAVKLLLWDQQRQGLLAFHDMLTRSKEKLRWMAVDFGGVL